MKRLLNDDPEDLELIRVTQKHPTIMYRTPKPIPESESDVEQEPDSDLMLWKRGTEQESEPAFRSRMERDTEMVLRKKDAQPETVPRRRKTQAEKKLAYRLRQMLQEPETTPRSKDTSSGKETLLWPKGARLQPQMDPSRNIQSEKETFLRPVEINPETILRREIQSEMESVLSKKETQSEKEMTMSKKETKLEKETVLKKKESKTEKEKELRKESQLEREIKRIEAQLEKGRELRKRDAQMEKERDLRRKEAQLEKESALREAQLDQEREQWRKQAQLEKESALREAQLDQEREQWRRQAQLEKENALREAQLDQERELWRRQAQLEKENALREAQLNQEREQWKRQAQLEKERALREAQLEKERALREAQLEYEREQRKREAQEKERALREAQLEYEREQRKREAQEKERALREAQLEHEREQRRRQAQLEHEREQKRREAQLEQEREQRRREAQLEQEREQKRREAQLEQEREQRRREAQLEQEREQKRREAQLEQEREQRRREAQLEQEREQKRREAQLEHEREQRRREADLEKERQLRRREAELEKVLTIKPESRVESEIFSNILRQISEDPEDTFESYTLSPVGWQQKASELPTLPRSPGQPRSPWEKSESNSSPECVLQCVGVGIFSDQLQKTFARRGLNFTLMVAGESGLGKSTLINNLFLTDVYKDDKLLNSEADPVPQTMKITTNKVKIVEEGLKLTLTIVDTPGFGDALNSSFCWKTIADYVDQQFEQYFRDESGLNRKNILDNRVHCCLYFISPFGHGLRPLDVEFMRALHERVSIIPILAKADALTAAEVAQRKRRIQDELEHFGIQIYQFTYSDSDDEEEFKKQDMELKRCFPFAVIASNTVVEKEGKRVRGRIYPWGIVEVEDPTVSDLMILRLELKAHMQHLKDVTREIYENYRLQCLQNMTRMVVKDKHGNYVPGMPM